MGIMGVKRCYIEGRARGRGVGDDEVRLRERREQWGPKMC
jgi:hypothetical protein